MKQEKQSINIEINFTCRSFYIEAMTVSAHRCIVYTTAKLLLQTENRVFCKLLEVRLYSIEKLQINDSSSIIFIFIEDLVAYFIVDDHERASHFNSPPLLNISSVYCMKLKQSFCGE